MILINPHMIRKAFILPAVLAWLLGSIDAPLAHMPSRALVELTPIGQAPSTAAVAPPTATLTPVRLQHEALRQALWHFRSTGGSAPKSAVQNSGREMSQSRYYAAPSNGKRTDGLKIWMRPPDGTVRWIQKAAQTLRTPAAQRLPAPSAPDRESDELAARQFLNSHRGLLRLKDPERELQVKQYRVDNLGRRHLRWSQSFDGVPVWPGEMIVHLDARGAVDKVASSLVALPGKMVLRPVLSPAAGLGIARRAIADIDAAAEAASELIVYAPGHSLPRLAWKLELAAPIGSHWVVVVDALNGTVLTAYDTVMTNNTAGSGSDLFGITRQLNIWQEGGRYYLVDTSKTMFDPTSDPPAPQTTRGGIIVLDAANQPPTSNPQSLPALLDTTATTPDSGWLADGVSAAHALSRTYDYFLDRHGRDSIDGRGGSIHAIVRLGDGYDNAFWSPDQNLIAFGDARPYAGALDVVAHELAHGVTTHTANLIYSDQSGAMNEAFSDIFGEMVEAYVDGSGPDWLMGTRLGQAFRNLADPGAIDIGGGLGPYPARMGEYINTSLDNGGVHLNSTIIGHAYYLLAEGLPGAIGLSAAEQIFFRALTLHLVANAQFVDLRLACLAAAEELFGIDSPQVLQTAQAFEAVEILDGSATPDPPELPPIDGDDAALFVYWDSQVGALALGRREGYPEPGGDPEQGIGLTPYLNPARPSVSGDGELAVFVDILEDVCFIATDDSLPENCLGFRGFINSLAMSADGNLFGFVFLDENGRRTDKISVIDLGSDDDRTYDLVAPVMDGVATQTILFADAMDFSIDNRYLVYDAYNVMEFDDGSQLGAWSIYAIDLQTGQTLTLVPPVPGLEIAYPAMSQTSGNLITFDAYDVATGESLIFAGNLISGELELVGATGRGYGVPGYGGDDAAIVFSRAAETPTEFSLWRQPLQADHITPQGDAGLYLPDADFGVIYRRGEFTAPEADISLSTESMAFGEISIGQTAYLPLTIENSGTADLQIETLLLGGSAADRFSRVGSCSGQILPAGGRCTVQVSASPTAEGPLAAVLTIASTDPDSAEVSVQLSASGVDRKGDLDFSGQPDLGDAIQALRISARLPALFLIHLEADVDGDGQIGLAEATYVLKWLSTN